MRIELDNPSNAPLLLQFLRERECIAYFLENMETIEVIRPEGFGRGEVAAIEAILKTWRTKNPEIGYSISE